MDIENLKNVISSGNEDEYVEMLCDFNELIDEVIFMLRNKNMYSKKDIKELQNNFKEICKIFYNK